MLILHIDALWTKKSEQFNYNCLIFVHKCCPLWGSYTGVLCESVPMEQHALKNVNNCLINNIYSYLETSGGQSSNLYLNAVPFFNTSVN